MSGIEFRSGGVLCMGLFRWVRNVWCEECAYLCIPIGDWNNLDVVLNSLNRYAYMWVMEGFGIWSYFCVCSDN